MPNLLIRLFGLLLMLSALALPLLQAPDRAPESLVARWAPPPSEFLDLRGQLVHYRDEGPRSDPEPIVLLHGDCASLHTWEGWAKALRGQRRVISLDLPGYGLTGPFTGAYAGQDYSSTHYAHFVLDLLDRLAVPRFVVAGNALGGEIAWRLALIAPQRTTRLVLVDALGYAQDTEATPMAWQLARLPLLGSLGEYLLPRALVAQALHLVYGDPGKVSDALVDRYYELALREGNRAAFAQRVRRRPARDGVAHVDGIAAPTLILWGGLDRLTPAAFGRRLAADIPGSQLRVFEELGHQPQEEDPLRTVATVKAFLVAPPP